MIDDATLLRRYAEENSEEAFAELVQRHLALVYAVALRKVGGDAALAQDVAQSVFTDLARKASMLAQREVLTGWLFTSTHYAAAKAVRAAQRRRRREQESQLMHELTSDSSAAIDWERLRPTLDDLIGELDQRDREAVLLRFFSGCDFAEVGARLRLSPDGARTRVNRALEKLQAALVRRGVTSTSAALGLALANQVGVAAPAGLATSVTSAALAGALAGQGAMGTLFFMSINKLAIGVVSAVALAGIVATWHEYRSNGQLQAELARARGETGALRTAQQAEAATATAAEMRLRDELAATQQRLAEAKRVGTAQAAANATGKLPPGMVPIGKFADGDRSSPGAAIGSLMWAASVGDVDALSAAIALDQGAREKAEAVLAGLPEPARAQYGTPEKLVALLLAADAPALRALQVVGANAQTGADDQEQMDARVLTTDGETKTIGFHFRRYADGWHAFLPGDFIAKVLLPKLTGESPAMPGGKK